MGNRRELQDSSLVPVGSFTEQSIPIVDKIRITSVGPQEGR
jgi:hypothetical protein